MLKCQTLLYLHLPQSTPMSHIQLRYHLPVFDFSHFFKTTITFRFYHFMFVINHGAGFATLHLRIKIEPATAAADETIYVPDVPILL